jgi:hypothetical protein
MWARRARDILSEHITDLGGPDNTSAAERSLARRAAVMAVELERLELRFASAGEAADSDLDLYQRDATVQTAKGLIMGRTFKDYDDEFETDPNFETKVIDGKRARILKDGGVFRTRLMMLDGADEILRDTAKDAATTSRNRQRHGFSDEDAARFGLSDGRQLHRPGWRFNTDHAADEKQALSYDNEFLFRNYGLEQIANGDNANHFFAFEYRQVTDTLIGHQGHAYLDRLFWPDMDYVSLHDIPDQRGGGPFAFENDIPGIVSLGYDADQFFTVHHN